MNDLVEVFVIAEDKVEALIVDVVVGLMIAIPVGVSLGGSYCRCDGFSVDNHGASDD